MSPTKEIPNRCKSARRAAVASSDTVSSGCAAGVVGMGLMGTSISACLLVAGHTLHCVEPNPVKLRTVRKRLLKLLRDSQKQGITATHPSTLLQRVAISSEFSGLKTAEIVIESTVEDLTVKCQVIREIEKAVSAKALIGSNTSAIPVTALQANASHPERIIGLHWAEPAHITRFMEIICGKDTSLPTARRSMRFARTWRKEPSLLRKDIPGFITNRIMYAMLREAFHLVDSGVASVADVDRSLRNDLGYWITFAGPFRFMDLTGIPAYASVMKELLPDLSCATEVPRLMQKVIRSGACGVSNGKGFYRYTRVQAKRWEKLFTKFSYEIRSLAEKYPEKLNGNKNTDTEEFAA